MAGLERNGSGAIATLDVRVEPHRGNPRRYLLRIAERHRREPLRPGERHGEALPPVSQPLLHPRAPGRGAGPCPPERSGREPGGHRQRRQRDIHALPSGSGRPDIHRPCGEQMRLRHGRVLSAADQADRTSGWKRRVRLARSEEPYEVSGRCSVFCKSDCTHATNKGVPKERVTAGLCLMMAGKILELVKKVSSDAISWSSGAAP